LNTLLAALAGLLIGIAIGAGAVLLRKRSMRRLRAHERRARMRERQDNMRALAGGLAHEIKNPLSTIGLNAQLLAEAIEDLDIPDDRRDPLLRRIDTLGREVERLRGILTDFLEYAGGLHLHIAMQDVNAVITELIDFFEPQAHQVGVRLRPDLAARKLDAPVDSAHLKQALLNLMLNAVQAMTDNPGELIIRTEKATEPDGTHAVIIHVIDTGPGMDPEVLDTIFQPYFTTKSAGSGLGLPTTRRLIEAHGGRIEVFSQPGKGTDITIILPADPIEPARPTNESPR
jgi:signal transduction histidine kinase